MNTLDHETAAPRHELLELLAAGEPPAFATSQNQRITFWNSGAARVLGRRASEVLGQRCHEVLHGRDLYGNLFCYENCPLIATARRGEPVSQCELALPTAGGARSRVAVTTLQLPGSRDESFTLVHVLQPLSDSPASRAPGARAGSEARSRRVAALQAAEAEPPLTPREREVLAEISSGLHNKEIAQQLGISLATVRNHVHNILDKLGVHSKLEAVCLAFRSGWVAPGGEPSGRGW